MTGRDGTSELTKPWPVLKSSQDTACDGKNPRTDDPCVRGQHTGSHCDAAGAEWLDSGDLARPDWLTRVPAPVLDPVHDLRD